MKHTHSSREISLQTPAPISFQRFDDARLSLARLQRNYERNTRYLQHAVKSSVQQGIRACVRFRAHYPALRIQVDTYQEVDSRLSFGHVVEPGVYETTITQPRLFYEYLLD